MWRGPTLGGYGYRPARRLYRKVGPMSVFAQSPSGAVTEVPGAPHPASAKEAYRVTPARPVTDSGVTATR
jgi:hypothetical protein